MYRGSSPASDEPEFQPLRRLKPLPKRRRTSDAPIPAAYDLIHPMADILGAEELAEELIAHADSFSLQSYYASVFGGTRNEDVLDLNAAYQLGKMGRSGKDQGEGDYTDHLQQPGNTKKRKVPANMSGAAQGREAEPPLGAEDEILDSLALLNGRTNHSPDLSALPPSVTPTPRKGKLTPSTLAGLQHKELLKHRKRQLAAVLGALSLGDTLALDQALSTHLPFAGSMIRSGSNPPRVRLSRRPGPRLARVVKAHASIASISQKKKPSFPTAQFVFTFSSATSDRLVATKQEVLALRNRFENELARQAAKVAKAAVDAKQAALTASKGAKSKRGEKTQQRALKGAAEGGDQLAEFLEMPGEKGKGKKKKKRNTLAIASNPHHRKNYVPSRLPSSGQANVVQANANAQNMLGPLPLRFLSAQIPPRRRKKANTVTPTAQIVNPADEWICPRCEHSLFYGEGSEYRQAVKNRKQILRRRRRAQERAAGGLNSSKTPANLAPSDEEDDYDNDYEPSPAQSPVIVKESDWKEGPDLGRSRGQAFIQTG
ncbi:hypothetical protein BDR05DRAFT_751416 [Suillus weaverae]|nr:hypothetical protein BDR05DRAFT_751416 [Suillus weaverae]